MGHYDDGEPSILFMLHTPTILYIKLLIDNHLLTFA
jgi:hypothetical protein